MQEILSRISSNNPNIEVIIFGSDLIVSQPETEWPVVDVLFSFFSTGFPIEKAIAYVNLRKPFMINSLKEQFWLMDRRIMYMKLKEAGINLPDYQFMSRDGFSSTGGEPDVNTLVEYDDYIVVNDVKIEKPFVEKPVDAEDHNIYIYYPRSAGGGSKRLFRKVGDKSSEFYPEVSNVRSDGSYIYEGFLPHGGTDVKVYAVGQDYAHAEARKSPVLDGKVHRDADGKEVRYPVLLTSKEKETAWKIAFIFGQRICGFDLLRANGKSYVCDVNGVSFVKKSVKFYDDTAALMSKMIIDACKAAKTGYRTKVYSHSDGLISSAAHSPTCGGSPDSGLLAHSPPHDDVFVSEYELEENEDHFYDDDDVEDDTKEELRCVIAVLRHGDRTPKQKLKMKIKTGLLLSFFDINCSSQKKELKLKSAKQLTEFLETVRTMISAAGGGEADSDNEWDSLTKYEQVVDVLEMGGGFSGINRKVQIKPLAWGHRSLRTGDKVHRDYAKKIVKEGAKEISEDGFCVEALLVVKWGGTLTQEGREQASSLGKYFRDTCYPGEGLGLLRLHSTFRHDLKIYSSEEGRVQMTAAAFAKGFLDLEGKHLTPILVSLVTSSSESTLMLDDTASASKDLERIKKDLHVLISSNEDLSNPEVIKKIAPTKALSVGNALKLIGHPLKKLHHILLLISSITFQLKGRMKKRQVSLQSVMSGSPPGSPGPVVTTASGESINLMFHRWDKIKKDFYSVKKDKFDLSKIPDIYDCVKYDLLHNKHLELEGLTDLYIEAKQFANVIVPQEYGITKDDKLLVGQKVAHVLLEKIKADLILSAYGDGTSVSTISSVLNENAHLFDGSTPTPIILNER
jgi:inositol hexakisphosphate/diphosphoinositol-pentakisphosphate kinase